MASAILVNVKEEVTCPICLELLKEPLSLGCGHNFCQRCIISNYQSTKGQKGDSRCPVCRVTYQLENLRPNWSVANIVETLKEVKLSPEEGQKVYHCARHGEKLLLFCQKERKVICWLCERSQEHRGHPTFLVEEVAQEYREKLKTTLHHLKKEEEVSGKRKADIQKERTLWKNQIQDEIRSVQARFKKQRCVLDFREKFVLQTLEKEEEDILNSLAESENELVQQSQGVRDLISDLEQLLEGSTIEMLQGVNGIVKRWAMLKLPKPKTFPKEQRRVLGAPDLNRRLQASQAVESGDSTTRPSDQPLVLSAGFRNKLQEWVEQVIRMSSTMHNESIQESELGNQSPSTSRQQPAGQPQNESYA